MKNILFFLILIHLPNMHLLAGLGESAVITLVFPYGSRSCAMGEVGTALADDESALYFNPAGLGIPNKRWQKGGASSYFYEQLLPALRLTELWHLAITSYYQPLPSANLGGFAAYCNFLNMGSNYIHDGLGRILTKVYSRETVMAFGWGFNFAEYGDTSRYYGISIKPFISALAPGLGPNNEGVGKGFAVDIGYLRLMNYGFRLGFTLTNMGPTVFYIDQSHRDPLPFSMNLALGYKTSIRKYDLRFVDIAAEIRLDKELVINNFDGNPDPFYKAMFKDLFNEPLPYELQEINIHTGFELGILSTLFYRHGFFFNFIGERYEMTYGFGIRLFNHIELDYANIYSPEYFLKPLLQHFDSKKEGATGVRHQQWRLNFTLTNIGNCEASDLKWWKGE